SPGRERSAAAIEPASTPMLGSVSSHSTFETVTLRMRVTPSVCPVSKSSFENGIGRNRNNTSKSWVTAQPSGSVYVNAGWNATLARTAEALADPTTTVFDADGAAACRGPTHPKRITHD